jgi:transposase InsO family protein
MTQPKVVGQRQRWLVVLSEFDMTEIAHIAGEKNVVADGLSRYPDPNGPSYEHLIPEHGNMDVRFANLNVRFTHLRLLEQDLLLHALFTDDDMTELYLTSTVTASESEPRPSLLPTPIRLFHAPTPLQEKNPEPVCRYCQSSTCDTLLAEFARHAIEPGLPDGVVNDPMLEHGFQEASIVEAQTDITAFVAAYADCPDFQKVYDSIKGLQHQETHDTWPDYSINENGLLMHRDGDNLRVCVPSSQRNLILRVMHDLPLGMHQGTAKMYALMAARFYFPKMAERVRAYIETCEHCQRNKAYTRNTRGVPRPSEVPLRRFDVVALDIVSGFPTTKTGFDAIVVFTDRLTKRVYIEPCTKTASARDLALIFFRTVFRSQGMPRVLLSDNGPQFTSAFWTEFFSLLQTDIRLTSSYHPQSNGQTERFNRTLIEALRSFVNARHDNWDNFLVHFEFAYNSTVNASTGFSPFILQFAQAPRAPWDSVLEGGENDSNGPLSGGDLAFSLGFDTLKNLKQARASLQEAAQRQRVRNALLTRPHEYAVDDEVLLSTENIALRLPSRKLSPKFVGPFRIVELRGKNAVKIQPTGRFRALHEIVNVEYLRPYNTRSENVGPPPHHLSVKPVAVEPLGEWYQIAEILDHRGRAGPAQQCLVRWEGFDASHDSWVPRRDITPKALVAYEEFLRETEPRQMPQNGHISRKHLTSFIGEHGEHSVIENSDNRRTSKMSVPRGERKKADDRRNGDEYPKVSGTASQSASDTDAPAAAGGGRARKPPGFYRV